MYPINSGSIGMLHQSVLELLESKPRNFGNPHNTRLLSCCFLHESSSKPILFLRNLVLHVLQALSAILALSCHNALRRQIVVHLDRNVAHSCDQFGDL